MMYEWNFMFPEYDVMLAPITFISRYDSDIQSIFQGKLYER